MIIQINKSEFKDIVLNSELDLPKRWDGNDFHETLKILYDEYQFILSPLITIADLQKVKTICDGILKSIEYYHNGFPHKAFQQIESVMKKLYNHPLKIYSKNGLIGIYDEHDPLMLFRIRNVQNNINYSRKDIFHTPYNTRSKISTCRYSISGYPCLYLGTSLSLCLEEAKVDNFNDLTIASRFQIQRNINSNDNTRIEVIELALKPKDFIEYNSGTYVTNGEPNIINQVRRFDELDLNSIEVMSTYLYWYPLIAACSYIRTNKQDPFASEYIIPQLLMQWIRKEGNNNHLIGIRYFSCASERASEIGFNYVFPVSGLIDSRYGKYCKVLSKSFKLTKPVFVHEFNYTSQCETYLKGSNKINYI